MKLLMADGHHWVDINRLHMTNASQKKLYDRVRQTLDLMGIRYLADVGRRLRLMTPKEIEAVSIPVPLRRNFTYNCASRRSSGKSSMNMVQHVRWDDKSPNGVIIDEFPYEDILKS